MPVALRVVLSAGALAACSMAPEGARDETILRQQAEEVVKTTISARYPALDASPIAGCVVENATGPELITIAKAAVLGPNDNTVTTVLAIVGRNATLDCILSSGISPLRL